MAVCDCEVWTPIYGSEGYEVSSHGRVRSTDRVLVFGAGKTRRLRGKILAHSHNQQGHPKVWVRFEGVRRLVYIHHEVARAFVGKRPDAKEVAHFDGQTGNCHFRNLRYATPLENAADKIRHGTHLDGERHHCALLSAAAVDEIRERLAARETHVSIGRRFGVSKSTIADISHRRTWNNRSSFNQGEELCLTTQ